MRFVIPGRLSGLNEMVNANRTNPYKGAKLKKDNERIVMDALRYQRVQPVYEPVYLRFMWVEPNKRRDKDNIASAHKYILDALVKMGILENDGWKQILGFSDRFAVDPKNPHIVVEILTEAEAEERQARFVEI